MKNGKTQVSDSRFSSLEEAYGTDLIHGAESSSEFLDTLLGTSMYGTISQVSKKIPAVSLVSLFFVSPSVLRSLPKVFKMNSEEVQRRIDTRGKTRHPDFVDYMLPADAPPPSTKKEKVHLEQVALQLFVAGYDPIQITLNSVFFYLIKEVEMYKALVQEIRGSFETYESITADAAAELPYLHAVLYEVLRIHVTNGTGMPRVSPGAMVDGIYVPKGVRIFFPVLQLVVSWL
jgi:cytochrome P450